MTMYTYPKSAHNELEICIYFIIDQGFLFENNITYLVYEL